MKANSLNILEERLDKIKKASISWLEMIDQYNIDDEDCVLVFPEEKNEDTVFFINAISELMTKRGFKRAHVLYFDKKIEDDKFELKNSVFYQIEKEKIEGLVYLYSLFDFSDRCYICSLNLPDGRLASQMKQEEYQCTTEEIVKIGIFRLG